MTQFEQLEHIIRSRRSTKPAEMNGEKIDSYMIHQLLQLADWAPTHAQTEPWRFMVFENNAVQTFCSDHARLYKENTAAEKFTEAKYQKLQHQGDTVSHIILVSMKRSVGNSIPAEEEYAAVAAAIQNMLLGAASLNLAALWSTGGMTHHPALKKYTGLAVEDVILGLVYLGYTDQPLKEGKRNIPVENKTLWKSS